MKSAKRKAKPGSLTARPVSLAEAAPAKGPARAGVAGEARRRKPGTRWRPTRRGLTVALLGLVLVLGGGYAIDRGRAAMEARRLGQLSIQELEKLAVRHPSDTGVLFQYGTALQKAGAHNDAVGVFARVVQLDGRNVSAYLGLAQSQGAIGNLSEAETAYKKAQELEPRNYPAHAALAHLYYLNGETASAAREMEAALKVRPNEARGWFTLGHLHGNLQRVDRAIEAFRQVTRLAPKRPDGWRALGRVYWHRGRLQEAEHALKRAQELRPGDPRTLLWLGQVYLRQPDSPETRKLAEETLRAAASAGPQPLPEALLELGRLLIQQDRLAHAETALRQALRGNPQLEPAHLELGRLLVRTGRKAEGETLLRRFEEMGSRRRQIQALESALQEKPDDPLSLLKLARLYREFRRNPEAMRSYRLYLTQRPQDEKVVEELVAYREEVFPTASAPRSGSPEQAAGFFGEIEHDHAHDHPHGPEEAHGH